MSAWIAVKERLPESESDVVCWSERRKSSFIGWFHQVKQEWRQCGMSCVFDPEVSHWQPLPAPPEVTR